MQQANLIKCTNTAYNLMKLKKMKLSAKIIE